MKLTEDHFRHYSIEDILEKPVTASIKQKTYYFGGEHHSRRRNCFGFWQRPLSGTYRPRCFLGRGLEKPWGAHLNVLHNQVCPLQAGDRTLSDG